MIHECQNILKMSFNYARDFTENIIAPMYKQKLTELSQNMIQAFTTAYPKATATEFEAFKQKINYDIERYMIQWQMAIHENNPYLVSINGQNHIAAAGKSNYLAVEPNNKYLQSNNQRTPENSLESESNQNPESLNKYLQSNNQHTPENSLESESNQNHQSLNKNKAKSIKNKATLNGHALIKNKVM